MERDLSIIIRSNVSKKDEISMRLNPFGSDLQKTKTFHGAVIMDIVYERMSEKQIS
jgi:hypothetical protein